MIVKGIILIILVFSAFIFLGLKISESVNSSSIRLFFFSLYFMTILSIFNLSLTIYFFIKLKDLKGPQGKKGLRGKPGDNGVFGSCGTGLELKMNFLRLLELKINELNNKEGITVTLDAKPYKSCNFEKIKSENTNTIEQLKTEINKINTHIKTKKSKTVNITTTDDNEISVS